MKKRCRKGEDDDERNDNSNNTKKNTKVSSSSPAEAAATWLELSLDVLGEIKKKLYLCNHVRFSCVCKSWLAAQHAKRAYDVLPWLLLLDCTNRCRVSYYMYEPSASHPDPVISHDFYISQFLDASPRGFHYYFTYHHGCLLIYTQDKECTYSYFLVFSLATNEVIQLPRLNCGAFRRFKLFTAVSTNPTSPDCVFLAFRIIDHSKWHISSFRQGDKQWTSTVLTFGRLHTPALPWVKDVVFIHGVFYFLFSNGRLGSYEVATMDLKVYCYSNNTSNLQAINGKFRKLFVLEEELVVTYYDVYSGELCIKRFDWSQKNWFPLNSLGERSVFLSKVSVVVDALNCYGVSPNKIYIHDDKNCSVYSLENGQLLKCTSSGLRNWRGINYHPELSVREVAVDKISIWVEPPKLL